MTYNPLWNQNIIYSYISWTAYNDAQDSSACSIAQQICATVEKVVNIINYHHNE